MRLLEYIKNKKTYIIAEMSANHGGSYESAKEIIRAAKESGADCIKLQTYRPDTLTLNCDNEYFKIKGGLWDGETYYDLYSRAQTPWEWHEKLKNEAEKLGLDFLSTPFDNTSVDFLESIGLEFFKIASFELIDIPLIRYVALKGKPIIISTGMGTLEEIVEAVETVRSTGNEDIILLKCSSAYPAITDQMNLLTIRDMEETFQVPVGLSDHSLGSVGAVTAIALGASVIEKHFCLNRKTNTTDAAFSMEPEEFRKMVEDIRQAEKAIGSVKYGPTEQEMLSIEKRRSIFCSKDIKKGEEFTSENIKIIRPGQGLHPRLFDDVIGRVALQDIKRGTPIGYEMIDGISKTEAVDYGEQ